MIVAIPVTEGRLSRHFGRCESYTFFEVEEDKKEIAGERTMIPPAHQPGVLPAWIAEQGGDVVITGGMGPRAIDLFRRNDIEVILGAPDLAPRQVVESFIDGSLRAGPSSCSHSDGPHGDGNRCR